jgi:branched-chain amino acid transport system substrate-binding protein
MQAPLVSFMSVLYQFKCWFFPSFRVEKIALWYGPIAVILLYCLIALLLLGCPPESPTVPSDTSSQSSYPSTYLPAEQRQLYRRAERLRSNGQLSQARQVYMDFVRRYPTSPVADDAMLALARIATALSDDREAQKTYEKLVVQFPSSDLVTQAYLELGISYYRMQDYTRSTAVLRQIIKRSASPPQLAPAHYYLGLIALAQQRFRAAIESLLACVETSTESDLTEKARGQIYRIVHETLDAPVLEQLQRQYPTVYPGDEILLRLAQLYRTTGRRMDEMATLQHFTTTFTSHPQIPEALERLRALQAALVTDRTKIGVLLPLSGEVSQYGQHALRGIELALTALQERYPEMVLSLVVRDSQLSGTTPGDTLRAMVDEAHVICVVGPLLSQVALDLAPVADELQVPLVSPYAPDGDFPSLSTYTFRNSMTDKQQARFLAEYAVNTRALRHFAVLYPDEPYGAAFKERFSEHVTQLGGEVMIAVPYPPDANDFSPQIKRLGGIDDTTLRDIRAGLDRITNNENDSRLRPPLFDAIFIPGYYDKAGLIAPALAFYNITGIQLLGTDGWDRPEIVDIGERFVEGAVFVDGFFPASLAPLIQEFVARYRQRYNETPDLFAAQAYDTLWMIGQTLLDGAETRFQVRDKLLHIQNLAGVSGMITMQANGEAEKELYLLSVRNGQIMQLN